MKANTILSRRRVNTNASVEHLLCESALEGYADALRDLARIGREHVEADNKPGNF